MEVILGVIEDNKGLFSPKYKSMVEISNQGDSELELFVPTSYRKNPSKAHCEKLKELLGAESGNYVNQGDHTPFWAFQWGAK